MSIMVPGWKGSLFGAVEAAPEAFLTPTDHSSGGSTTFTGLNTGAAHVDRYVVVSISAFMSEGGSMATFTAVSIGGVSATLLVQDNPGTYQYVGIWIAAVPTGTSANVVITSTGHTRFSIQVYRLVGVTSIVPHDTDITIEQINLDIPANGAAIMLSHRNMFSTSPPGSGNMFSLDGGVTENFINLIAHPTVGISGGTVHAHKLSVAGETIAVNTVLTTAWAGGWLVAGVSLA
jgi:hypothetical protein